VDTKPLAKELAKLALTKKADFMSTIAGLKDQLASGASNVGNSMMSGASDLKARLLAAYNQLSPDAKAALISSLAGGAGMGAASLLTGGASPLADALLGSALGGIGGYAGSNLYRKYKGDIAPPNANVDPNDIQHAITAANPDYVQDMLGQGAVGGLSGAGLGYAAQGMHNMTAGRIPKLQELAAEFHKNPNAIYTSLAQHKADLNSLENLTTTRSRLSALMNAGNENAANQLSKVDEQLGALRTKLRANTPVLANNVVDDSIARWFRGGTTTIDGKALPEANWFRRHGLMGDELSAPITGMRKILDNTSRIARRFLGGKTPPVKVNAPPGANWFSRLGLMGDGFSTPTAGIRKILDNTLREADVNPHKHMVDMLPETLLPKTQRRVIPVGEPIPPIEVNWNGMIDRALDAHMSPPRFGAPKLKWIGPAAATGAALTTVGPHVWPYISSILEHGLGQDQ